MLDIGKYDGPRPNCLVTSAKLSNFIDHSRPPNKKKPFSTILNQTYSHTLDILLSVSAAKTLQESLNFSKSVSVLQYAKLHLKLEEILTGSFFNSFIKAPSSNILLRSEGRAGIDNLFTLTNGILRLEIDSPTFERMGLQGKAIPSEGRKHVKARYAVEINLREPSMIAGKKGFERVLWAARNVLSDRVAWLMIDLRGLEKGENLEESSVLKEWQPMIRNKEAESWHIEGAMVPAWPESGVSEAEYEEVEELLEWISLAMMGSSRVRSNDRVDPFLCRYEVPTNYGETKQEDLVRLRWRGLVHPAFAQKIFLAALKATGHGWFAISAHGFSDEGYTSLIYGEHSIIWEFKG